jgi:hypothetical protein
MRHVRRPSLAGLALALLVVAAAGSCGGRELGGGGEAAVTGTPPPSTVPNPSPTTGDRPRLETVGATTVMRLGVESLGQGPGQAVRGFVTWNDGCLALERSGELFHLLVPATTEIDGTEPNLVLVDSRTGAAFRTGEEIWATGLAGDEAVGYVEGQRSAGALDEAACSPPYAAIPDWALAQVGVPEEFDDDDGG